jgi:hypothetical protein
MLRWLLPLLGLAVAVAAGWLLLVQPTGDRGDPPAAARGGPESLPRAAPRPASPEAPMADIDDASRRALERILEDEGAAE